MSDAISAVSRMLLHLAATLNEAACLQDAQRDSTCMVLQAYHSAAAGQAPTQVVNAAFLVLGNAERLAIELDKLADQVGDLALHMRRDGPT